MQVQNEGMVECVISCMLTRQNRFFANVAEYGHLAADSLREMADQAMQSVDAEMVTTGDGEIGLDFAYSIDLDEDQSDDINEDDDTT
jgi:hypothetical protein